MQREWQVSTPEMLQRCKEYGLKLSRKHPNWKPDRIARKVAEHFRLKAKGTEFA